MHIENRHSQTIHISSVSLIWSCDTKNALTFDSDEIFGFLDQFWKARDQTDILRIEQSSGGMFSLCWPRVFSETSLVTTLAQKMPHQASPNMLPITNAMCVIYSLPRCIERKKKLGIAFSLTEIEESEKQSGMKKDVVVIR